MNRYFTNAPALIRNVNRRAERARHRSAIAIQYSYRQLASRASIDVIQSALALLQGTLRLDFLLSMDYLCIESRCKARENE